MNANHTCEEWTIPSHVVAPDIPIIAGSRIVALVVNDEDEPIDDAEQLANARLMAAAPRLLESLRIAERVIRYAAQESAGRVRAEIVGGWLHHANEACVAIAEATGNA